MTQKDELSEMFGGYSHVVEAIVSLDERGQMILPKEVRTKADIKAGDKLALISLGKSDKVCCVMMIKAKLLEDHVKASLGPVMKEIFKQ
jgi:antitoxin PrlF